MKTSVFLGMAAIMMAPATACKGVTLLSQNFDNDPVNFTNSPFAVDTTDPAQYWAPTNFPGIAANPGILGNTTTYLAGQNMDLADGDGFSLPFDTNTPAFVNFDVDVTGYTDLSLSIDLAGMPTAEVENYLRAFTDQDGDGFYELLLFNFVGANNSPYIDGVLGSLTETFATFNVALPAPTAANGILHLRLEVFNDTNSQNEAHGIDNIIISGTIPEPGSVMLTVVGGLWLLRRRRSLCTA